MKLVNFLIIKTITWSFIYFSFQGSKPAENLLSFWVVLWALAGLFCLFMGVVKPVEWKRIWHEQGKSPVPKYVAEYLAAIEACTYAALGWFFIAAARMTLLISVKVAQGIIEQTEEVEENE